MINSYIITFDTPKALDIGLEEIKKIGASIESVQYFIGTVVLMCEPQQAELIKSIEHVIGVIESGTIYTS